MFPRPPSPPFKNITFSFGLSKSSSSLFVSKSLIIVPTGTFIIKSSPDFPVERAADPFVPSCALNFLLLLKSTSVLIFGSAIKTISPPFPPSPPSGPPNWTNFSRLNVAAPSPPFPEITVITLSSINILSSFSLFHFFLFI